MPFLRTHNHRIRCAGSAILTLCSIQTMAHGWVEIEVTRVGFSTLQEGDVVRRGIWTPVIVDAALVDEEQFDGYLRVSQFDQDGDKCYDRVPLHLRRETGGTQRLFLYALPNSAHVEGRFSVSVYDENGESVRVVSQGEPTYQALPARQPVNIAADDVLLISLSSGAIGRTADLVASESGLDWWQPLHVGHMSPADLPELWIGLEAVDYIVWDDARPESLTAQQIAALAEWVRQGGTLLVAASRTAGSLRLASGINSILPVDLGQLVTVENLPEFRRTALTFDSGERAQPRKERALEAGTGRLWWDIPFVDPIPIVECTLRPDGFRVFDEASDPSAVLTRRDLGRGQVFFCAVALKDLLRDGGSAAGLFQRLFQLRSLKNADDMRAKPVSLFAHVASAVAFARSGSLYLAAALLFSAMYLLVATFGSWGLLTLRGWRHHSWTAFALVAVAASGLCVVAVGSLRGIGETLHQVSIIDAVAGNGYGYATTLMGLKTGTDRRLDLWLPLDPLGATEPGKTTCFLRPLRGGSHVSSATTSFADPGEYLLQPASAVIRDVRIRATLKRFEGRWEGALRGTVTGEIAARGPLLLDGSYIANHLGVDLTNCYLLHTVRPAEKQSGPRSGDIYAYPIGDVPSDGTKVDLVSRCYPVGRDESVAQVIARRTLANAQRDWGSEFAGMLPTFGYGWREEAGIPLGQEKNALLLVSTSGEHDPGQEAGMRHAVFGPTTWSRDGLRQLDLRSRLRADTAVFIGFTEDPGPVRLFRRSGDRPFALLKPDPDHSWAMYRIQIPVTVYAASGEPGEEKPAVMPW